MQELHLIFVFTCIWRGLLLVCTRSECVTQNAGLSNCWLSTNVMLSLLVLVLYWSKIASTFWRIKTMFYNCLISLINTYQYNY